MKIKRPENLQKQKTQGREKFPKGVYSFVNERENFESDKEIGSFSRISIDIFVDIIDNYGDMGWVLECILMSGIGTVWNIVTNDTVKMRRFLEKSGHTIENISVISKEKYNPKSASKVIFLSLHANVNPTIFPEGTLFFRINYLSFDPWYREMHLQEHIASTPEKKIIELTYSPLPGTGGVWQYLKIKTSRKEWLSHMKLDKNLEQKIWIPIFVYEKTLENLDLPIDENIVIFQIGGKKKIPGAIYFDWIPRDDFWDLLDLADMNIIRGEISLVRALSSGKPFLWDMYKELGGWNQEESVGFLDFMNQGNHYNKIHNTINSGNHIGRDDILSIQEEWQEKKTVPLLDFAKTLQKTLDSFDFSL